MELKYKIHFEQLDIPLTEIGSIIGIYSNVLYIRRGDGPFNISIYINSIISLECINPPQWKTH